MRVYVALFPAAMITLALFCLMQYLISGHRIPVKLPDYQGFVHLVRLQQDPVTEDSMRARRALPVQSARPEDTLPLPQPATAATATPEFPELAIALPGLAPLELDRGPYLARPGEHAVTQKPPIEPDSRTVQKNIPEQAPGMQATNTTPSPPASMPGMSGLTGELTGMVSSDEVIPLLRIDPDYPRKAARAREEGWVRIEFTITENGTVVDPVVVEARPRRTFNRSALAAIRKWQFKPKLSDGKPVSRKASQVIEFRLANR